MFNNSEPYGRNELPNNMITQVALSQISHTNNNALNFNILGKQNCVSPHKNTEPFNVQSFSEFGQVPMSFEPPTSPFVTPQSDGSEDGAQETMHPGLNFVAVDVPKVFN